MKIGKHDPYIISEISFILTYPSIQIVSDYDMVYIQKILEKD